MPRWLSCHYVGVVSVQGNLGGGLLMLRVLEPRHWHHKACLVNVSGQQASRLSH